MSQSYYSVLGLDRDSSISQIRNAYRKLAMQWHPDRWTRSPPLLGEAKRKFQQIQEAYSVLSDQRKRSIYDAGLFDPFDEEEENEGFTNFVQEMLSLMANVKKEGKCYSMGELQQMLMDMAQGFNTLPQWPKRARWDTNQVTQSGSHHIHISGLQMCGKTGFCS